MVMKEIKAIVKGSFFKMKTVYKKILNHYGEEHQVCKLMEEMAELALALLKKDVKNIHEELADVEIMLEQLKLMSFYDEEKKEIKKLFKLNRQINRINEEVKKCQEQNAVG